MVLTPPPELDDVLSHLRWRKATLSPGVYMRDLALDKPTVKVLFDREALRACVYFMVRATDAWLIDVFEKRLSNDWRDSMGKGRGDLDHLRYLSGRISAELGRASGMPP